MKTTPQLGVFHQPAKEIMRKLLLITILAILPLSACVLPPRDELARAQTAVARAYAAEAPELAPEEYEEAFETLRRGEDLFYDKQYNLAKEVLPFAEYHAYRALLKVREVRADMELKQIREEQMKARIEAEAQAKAVDLMEKRPPTLPTKQAISKTPQPSVRIASLPEAETKKKPEPPPPPITSYRVEEGDSLWNIAARREIYLDALLWPLIYKANRDQIKDPRRVDPGQVLTIPRQVSEGQKAEIRKEALGSSIFPVGSAPLSPSPPKP